jgi:hypothetical protein
MDSDKADLEARQTAASDWKPSRHELLIIITLALVSLMISLDATIVVTSIGVIKSLASSFIFLTHSRQSSPISMVPLLKAFG